MILQALKEYYDRKAGDLPPEGFEKKPFPFLIVIDQDGRFINLEDTREKLTPRSFLVPKSAPRSGSLSYKTTFLLWDHIGYVLGHPGNELAMRQHETWIRELNKLPSTLGVEPSAKAIIKFYQSGGVEKVKAHIKWNECAGITASNIAFKLVGEKLPTPCSKAVEEFVRQQALTSKKDLEGQFATADKDAGRCLVTGDIDNIVRIHSDTRISKDAKKLVSFQKNSGYDSYGKEQAYNAPIGRSAEFAYTTALNTLLKSSSKMLIGDAVTVFWSELDSELENLIADFFREPPKDDPDRGVRAVQSLFRSIQSGAFFADDSLKTRFYVLGLSPNVARISVRFWIVDTIAGIATKIKQHFDDLQIAHDPADKDVFSLYRLLICTAVLGKADNIPPNLAGETVRSILAGLPYPKTLLQAAIRRIRAEHAITYPRAALIKACINRETRFRNPKIEEELKMSLDERNTNIGYRLGRLFAVLEKIQQEANPGINTTIRDRFYGAASGTPVTVFGNLMRLKNHHLAKLGSAGRRIYFEKLIGGILDGINAGTAFPAHLSLEEQGRFAIGYYHQQQDFFTRK
jgi:CRISPR-associated protein Csd1